MITHWFRIARASGRGDHKVAASPWIYCAIIGPSAVAARKQASARLRIAIGHDETEAGSGKAIVRPWRGLTLFQQLKRPPMALHLVEHPISGFLYVEGWS